MSDTKLNENFAQSVRAFREAVGESTLDFSQRAGVSKSAYLKIEHGKANPTLDTVQIMADSLEVDPLFLLGAPENYSALLMIRMFDSISYDTLDTIKRSALSLVNTVDFVMEYKLLRAQNAQETANV